MSLFVLDSDTIRLLRDRHPKVESRVLALAAPDEIATTVISVHEGVMGWHTYLMKAKTPKEVEYGYQEFARTVAGFAGLPILIYSQAAIARCDRLVKLKLGVKKNDLRISAIVLEAGGIVVTRNLRDFQRVPGLTCEDWSA
jgi:tRNA(fMet)-specific endonuclease VapC